MTFLKHGLNAIGNSVPLCLLPSVAVLPSPSTFFLSLHTTRTFKPLTKVELSDFFIKHIFDTLRVQAPKVLEIFDMGLGWGGCRWVGSWNRGDYAVQVQYRTSPDSQLI